MIHMKICMPVILSLCLPCILLGQSEMQTKLESLINSAEFKGAEREALQSLPVESLPQLTTILEQASEDIVFSRSIAMIGMKFAQFEPNLSEPERARLAQVVIDGCKRAPRSLLPQNLLSLSAIRRTEITTFAATLLNDDDPSVKAAAQRLVEIGSPRDVPNSNKQAEPISLPNINATVQSPAPTKAPEPMPTAPSDGPTSSTSWSVIVVLIVAATGLLWLLLKRRS